MGKEIMAPMNCMTHIQIIVWVHAESHVVKLGGTYSYLRMCLNRISQS
jgi:hypothetical protein